jgi:hypothetical protein
MTAAHTKNPLIYTPEMPAPSALLTAMDKFRHPTALAGRAGVAAYG